MTFSQQIEMAESICTSNDFGFTDADRFSGPYELITAILNGDIDNQTDYDLFCELEPTLVDLGYEGRALNRIFKEIMKTPVVATSLGYGYIKTRTVLESALESPSAMKCTEYGDLVSLAA